MISQIGHFKAVKSWLRNGFRVVEFLLPTCSLKKLEGVSSISVVVAAEDSMKVTEKFWCY